MLNDALGRIEEVVDSGAPLEAIEAALPAGVRPRQLSVRTLLVGIGLCIADDRPAHLTRIHQALSGLGEVDAVGLGVVAPWRGGPHRLTYRQLEYTFGLVRRALDNVQQDGRPSELLSELTDALCEASVPDEDKAASSSLAIDWSDHESFARPPSADAGPGADPEATWGHRSAGVGKDEHFYGYYLQTATMVRDEGGAAVPELVRRMTLNACRVDPPGAFVAVLDRMVKSGVALGDVVCDSGYAHRRAEHWALPVRRLGGVLVTDLHPHDRGTRGTHCGAICWNGNLYCPATPAGLLSLGPLARSAGAEGVAAHDEKSAELDRFRLGRVSADDADGYHRVACPAALGKVRCALRPDSVALGYDRPEVAHPPGDPPTCCTQRTITVPAHVNAKTAQKHPYPSKAHRRSYARRTGVERGYSTMKDRSCTDTTRGWCRVMGLAGITVLLACAVVVRNLRILDAFDEHQREDARRAEEGLAPRTRKRRRTTLADLTAAPP